MYLIEYVENSPVIISLCGQFIAFEAIYVDFEIGQYFRVRKGYTPDLILYFYLGKIKFPTFCKRRPLKFGLK